MNTKTHPPLNEMRPRPRTVWLSTAVALAMSALLLMPAGPARAGGDHGDAPPAAAGPVLPRFAASSELFELVGVLQGRQLTLYLDHAASNAPVREARLELELGGKKLQAERHADGEFELTLAAAPEAGPEASHLPWTATISTPQGSDLLAGELEIAAAAAQPKTSTAGRTLALAAAALALLGSAALFALWRRRRARPLPATVELSA